MSKNRTKLNDDMLDSVAGGNFGFVDPDGDGAGEICVFYYSGDQEVPVTGYLKYDNSDAVKNFLIENRGTMSDEAMFYQMQALGILHE